MAGTNTGDIKREYMIVELRRELPRQALFAS
jgi:hypothetical protein